MRAILHRGCISWVLVLLASTSQGATLRVERDGSGEYTALQPALDAAAAGDTVLIGPGEYTEMTPQYLPNAGGWFDVAGCVRVSNVTLIGAGASITMIGPGIYSGAVNIGIAYPVSGDLRILDLTLRNCNTACHLDYGRIFVEDCSFVENDTGLGWYTSTSGGGVWNSHFSSPILYNNAIFLLGSGQDILIENCTFDNSPIEIQSVRGVQIRDCEMYGGGHGVTVSTGGGISLERCQIYDMYGVGVILRPSSASVDIDDCEISAAMDAVTSYGEGNSLHVINTILNGGSRSVIQLTGVGPAFVRYSHIFKGSSEYSIVCSQFESQGGVRHDFRGNYWGTADGALISSWILDGHDDPLIRAEVLYQPFYGGPVDNETTSWGDLKAMWR